TLAPSFAKRSAMARPMPLDAPVIKTFFPLRRSIVVLRVYYFAARPGKAVYYPIVKYAGSEPMRYDFTAIAAAEVPPAHSPILRHLIETYASETNKTCSVWRAFDEGDLPIRPHERCSTVLEILRHQLLSERRFFGEFLGTPEPAPDAVLPASGGVAGFAARLVELARPRLPFLAARPEAWWLEHARFFDVERERIWIF